MILLKIIPFIYYILFFILGFIRHNKKKEYTYIAPRAIFDSIYSITIMILLNFILYIAAMWNLGENDFNFGLYSFFNILIAGLLGLVITLNVKVKPMSHLGKPHSYHQAMEVFYNKIGGVAMIACDLYLAITICAVQLIMLAFFFSLIFGCTYYYSLLYSGILIACYNFMDNIRFFLMDKIVRVGGMIIILISIIVSYNNGQYNAMIEDNSQNLICNFIAIIINSMMLNFLVNRCNLPRLAPNSEDESFFDFMRRNFFIRVVGLLCFSMFSVVLWVASQKFIAFNLILFVQNAVPQYWLFLSAIPITSFILATSNVWFDNINNVNLISAKTPTKSLIKIIAIVFSFISVLVLHDILYITYLNYMVFTIMLVMFLGLINEIKGNILYLIVFTPLTFFIIFYISFPLFLNLLILILVGWFNFCTTRQLLNQIRGLWNVIYSFIEKQYREILLLREPNFIVFLFMFVPFLISFSCINLSETYCIMSLGLFSVAFLSIIFISCGEGSNQSILEAIKDEAIDGVYDRRYISFLQPNDIKNATILLCNIDNFEDLSLKYTFKNIESIVSEMIAISMAFVRKEDIIIRMILGEFVIIMPGYFPDEAYVKAEKIRRAIEKANIRLHDIKITVSISISFVHSTESGNDLENKIRLANFYLKKYKKSMMIKNNLIICTNNV